MSSRPSAATARIVRNPRVLSGEPIVGGTRIPVRSIVLVWREVGSVAGVRDAYPQLSSADVRDALAFYEAHTHEVDQHIQANLAED